MLTLDMRMMRRSKSKRFLFSSFIFFAPCFAMAALLEVRLPLRFVLGTWDPRVFTWHKEADSVSVRLSATRSDEPFSSRASLGPVLLG